MKEPGTIRLHRVIRAPADRVYRAFLDPDALAKFPPRFRSRPATSAGRRR